jgi:hypothetical protein
MSIFQRFRTNSPAMLLVVAGLLIAFSGLALAVSGRTHGQSRDAMSHEHAAKSKSQAKHDDRADPNEGRDTGEGQGPPAWTHGYAVSKVAHDTPPGPGHGQAVSAAARSWGKAKHGRHANRHASGHGS